MEVCFFWHWEWKLMNASFQLVLILGLVLQNTHATVMCNGEMLSLYCC